MMIRGRKRITLFLEQRTMPRKIPSRVPRKMEISVMLSVTPGALEQPPQVAYHDWAYWPMT